MLRVSLAFILFFIASVQCGCTSEVFSVLAGYPVSYSGRNEDYRCSIANLDNPNFCWCSYSLNTQQWIAVSSMMPEKWIGVITQGRPTQDQWVTQYQVSYTLDGQDWMLVDDGKIF